jgi:hypothetical protein
MESLQLISTRKIEIVEPNTIYNVYKGLVLDYCKVIYSEYTNAKNEWFYEYYKSSYENLINLCNHFISNKYELNIPFENACELYNLLSGEFDKHLKDIKLTKDSTNFKINYIHMELDAIIKDVFKRVEF